MIQNVEGIKQPSHSFSLCLYLEIALSVLTFLQWFMSMEVQQECMSEWLDGLP